MGNRIPKHFPDEYRGNDGNVIAECFDWFDWMRLMQMG